ncbi:hypothetical protein V8B97DRAFT_1870213 [Scleroderma yunnanense]
MLPSSLRWMWLATLTLGLLSIRPLWVFAQQSSVICSSEYSWVSLPFKAQNPCLIAAYLQGACIGGSYTVPLLEPNTSYVGPYVDETNPCECNSVTYNLMAACSTCQNQTYIAWSSWSNNCSTIYPGVYPENIPSGTAVPNWAYQVVTTSDLFNVTLAQLTGGGVYLLNAPESSATKATAIVATSTMPISSITGDTQSPNSSPSSSSKSNIGDIVGGAVGGVCLAAIAAFITWFCIRCRQTKPLSARYDGTNSMYTAMSAFTPPVTQPKFYDPSDPSTFPTSAPSPTIHTSPYNDHQNNTIHSGVNVVQSGRPGAYSGVPIL